MEIRLVSPPTDPKRPGRFEFREWVLDAWAGGKGCHQEWKNPQLEEVNVPRLLFLRRERNVARDRGRRREDRTEGHPTGGGADGPTGEVGGDSPAVAQSARADRPDRQAAGHAPQDGPAAHS